MNDFMLVNHVLLFFIIGFQTIDNRHWKDGVWYGGLVFCVLNGACAVANIMSRLQ
jgi:hypothetical protein